MTSPRSGEGGLHLLGNTAVDAVDVADVGAKAFNLMRMLDAGLPVPPGFVLGATLGVEAATRGELPVQLDELLLAGVRAIEATTGLRFGAERRPLLLAVRSGAAVSMPGMLETILDVGLTDATAAGLLRLTGNPRLVWDSYRRLVQGYGDVVLGCDAAAFEVALNDAMRRRRVTDVSELEVSALREVTRAFQEIVLAQTGAAFPQEPMEQLRGAAAAVLRSWMSPRAVRYREMEALGHEGGTAVTVQRMVFGNTGLLSGAGVGFTRDPGDGEDRLVVDFLPNAQGEDVVAGRHTAHDSEAALARIPGALRELGAVRRRLERLFGDAQDFEFTIEEGVLYILQTRPAPRTSLATLRIAAALVDEGLIDDATAWERVAGVHLDTVATTRLAAPAGPIALGIAASPGVAAGRVALDAGSAHELAAGDDPVVLVRPTVTTDDIDAMSVAAAMVTRTGSRTSHAALVARRLGLACVVGCPVLSIDASGHRCRLGDTSIAEGQFLTVDGSSGAVYEGRLDTVSQRPTELLERVRGWAPASLRAGP